MHLCVFIMIIHLSFKLCSILMNINLSQFQCLSMSIVFAYFQYLCMYSYVMCMCVFYVKCLCYKSFISAMQSSILSSNHLMLFQFIKCNLTSTFMQFNYYFYVLLTSQLFSCITYNLSNTSCINYNSILFPLC